MIHFYNKVRINIIEVEVEIEIEEFMQRKLTRFK